MLQRIHGGCRVERGAGLLYPPSMAFSHGLRLPLAYIKRLTQKRVWSARRPRDVVDSV